MKRLIILLLLFSVIFGNTAFASNWVAVARDEASGTSYHIEADSVVKNGDVVKFMAVVFFDKERTLGDIKGVKKILLQIEAKTAAPWQDRVLGSYVYGDNEKELHANAQPDENWTERHPGSPEHTIIQAALKYAK